jgi:hypothetical protein
MKTQVFDPALRRGDMLVSGKVKLYAIRATRTRDDGAEHRPYFAREGHGPWNDSIKHAELWGSVEEVRKAIRAVEWDCTVEPVSVVMFIGKVEPV